MPKVSEAVLRDLVDKCLHDSDRYSMAVELIAARAVVDAAAAVMRWIDGKDPSDTRLNGDDLFDDLRAALDEVTK